MTTTPTPETTPEPAGTAVLVDGRPVTRVALRASDADRHATVTRLQDAVAVGLLTTEEGSERMAAAYDARFLTELPPLTADLPESPAPAPRVVAPGWRSLLAMAWLQLRLLITGTATGRPSRRRLAIVGGIGIALIVLVVLGAWGLHGLVEGAHGHDGGGFDGR